jgi:hypothetical protein
MVKVLDKFLKDCKKNPWIAIAGVLTIIVIISFSANFFTGYVSAGEAGQRVLDFVNNQGAGAELVEVNDEGFFYEVVLSVQGKQVPLYVTRDGEFFTQSLVPLDSGGEKQESSQVKSSSSIERLDRPIVELFVMSHCPYGTQMEKGIIPVVRELGDEIDFEIKFVDYIMHPTQGEVEEQLIQYCVQEEQNSKYLDYLSCFLEDGNSQRCLSEVGVDMNNLEDCTIRVDKEFDIVKNLKDESSWANGRFPKFMIYAEDNKKYGVAGSPTLIVNGAKVESGRDAQSILDVVCSAFNDAPEGCNVDMTSFGMPSPGFGFGGQGGSASSAGCGV